MRHRDGMRRPWHLAAALTAAARLARSTGPGPTGPERRVGERIGPTPSANSPHRSLALLERRKGTVFVLRLGIGRAPVIVGAADIGRVSTMVARVIELRPIARMIASSAGEGTPQPRRTIKQEGTRYPQSFFASRARRQCKLDVRHPPIRRQD